MATIQVRGTVWQPKKGETRENKPFVSFNLSEGVKQKDGSYKNVSYRVTQWDTDVVPEERSMVQVEGYFKVTENERDGKKYTNLEINAQSVALAPRKDSKDIGQDFGF